MTVFETIARRTSCRAYRPDPVSSDDLKQLLEAVRLAPSACNRQPWRLAVAQDADIRRRIVEEGFLPGLGMHWAREAPVHVIFGMARNLITHRLGASISGVDYPWIDIGIAGEHLVLAAAALGLGTCWIGWIKPRPLARLAGWPRTVLPVAVITVGHPRSAPTGAPSTPNRKPIGELVSWL